MKTTKLLLLAIILVLIFQGFFSFNKTLIAFAEDSYINLPSQSNIDLDGGFLVSLKPPGIPNRPSFNELHNDLKSNLSVNNLKEKQVPEKKEVRVKNFPPASFHTKPLSSDSKISDEDFAKCFEKSFSFTFAKLFSRALYAIKSLNLSIKSFDSNAGKIIASDKFRNTFIVQVLNDENNKSKIKILSQGSTLGKIVLVRTSEKLLKKITDVKTN